MDSNTKSRLKGLMDSHESKKLARSAAVQKIQEEENVFIKALDEKISNTIKPVFDSFSRDLTKRGHECNIKVTSSLDVQGSSDQLPSITLDVFVDGIQPAVPNQNAHPSITFSLDPGRKKVAIFTRHAAPGVSGSGPAGSYDLDQITKEFVGSKILEVLEKSL